MKKFQVRRNIPHTPTLFGLPMQAGGAFFGASVINAIIFIFLPVGPLFKLGGIAAIPVALYVALLLFFSRYTFGTFEKSVHSVRIHAIRNKNLSIFKDGLAD